MLLTLTIENYLLIEQMHLSLDPRLTIITGETGTGKSILLGALGLLLGNKSDANAILDPTRNCRVEGCFDLTGLGLEGYFEQNELDYAPQTTITRLLTPAGKSRVLVNDIPVPLGLLRELGSRLLDIHSQHQNLTLSDEQFRMHALDTVAANRELLDAYRTRYDELQRLERELAALREESQRNLRDREWLGYQVEELAAASLKEGEAKELESELSVLEHADRINETLLTLRNALDEDETGILSRLKASESNFERLAEHYPAAAEFARRLRSTLLELKDIGATAAEENQRIESDPERLQKISQRLDTLYTLCQKHRASDPEELLAIQARYTTQLAAIQLTDERIGELDKRIGSLRESAGQLAERLHAARQTAAVPFSEGIEATLARLGMPEARFEIELRQAPQLTQSGTDRVEFLFTANARTQPQPVQRIASGGELSRVMLALKALLAERTELPTILFDEIDTGVSGRIADAMGEIIHSLARKMQVIDITHLPQVASKGDTHLVVYKEEGHTRIVRLDERQREDEIAKMLSGSQITDAARKQARILLGKE